jgi:hypothetical protein
MKILKMNELSDYDQRYPIIYNTMAMTDDEMQDQDYFRQDKKFQEIQEYMKQILKPIMLKKNKNLQDSDIEKASDLFFSLGGNKSREIKGMVEKSKDSKKCAKEIVNKYIKYVRVNFFNKDDVNDIEQDSVMNSESVDHVKNYKEWNI